MADLPIRLTCADYARVMPLAVGDVKFQAKCIGKMHDVSEHEGRTVLFVSHHLNAIQKLCNVCAILEQGQLVCLEKDVPSVIKRYTDLIGL